MIAMLEFILFMIFLLYEGSRWLYPRPLRTPHPSARRLSELRSTDEPLVSFLVPVWNGIADIDPFFAAYHKLTWRNKEMIMCAGGSDGSYQRAQQFAGPGVVILEQSPGTGKQKALRLSFPHSSGGIVFLTDIDCRVTDENVTRFVRILQGSHAGAVTGSICPPEEQRKNQFVLVQWAIERMGDLTSSAESKGLRGNNAAVQREAIEKTRCFEVDVFSGTDYTMAKEFLNAGYQILYERNCEMVSTYPDSLRIYIRKQARWIRNVFRLGIRYRNWDEVRAVAATLVIPILYALLIAVGFKYAVSWEFAGFLFVHALMNRFHYARYAHIAVTGGGILLSVVGDLGATLVTSYQVITNRSTW